MDVFLNRIDGVDDAIISMFQSKRTLTRQLEQEIRSEVYSCSNHDPASGCIGALIHPTPQLLEWLDKLFKWGEQHITMLRFIDLSFTVYGLHRGGQDDWDAHDCRYNNRIIRASTRLGKFNHGEMSEWYEGKIVPTDLALEALGLELPGEIIVDGQTYIRGVNGYILKGHENDKDYQRGLYMLSIPSSFIFRVQLTEFAHVYRERRMEGTANPEVKQVAERCVDQVEGASYGYVNRDKLLAIRQ